MQEGSAEMNNNNKPNQDRGIVKSNQPENQHQQPQQPHQPQKCPRCESLNTKFCYYNNYSLSQPRYFCKTCRRYWTQGGTLRNVPVGGGCRKGKRAKTTSSSSTSGDSSRPTHPPPPQQQQPPVVLPSSLPENLTNPQAMMIRSSSVMASSQFYPGGSGYLSSVAAIQSFNQPTSFSQSLLMNSNQLAGLGGSSSSASSSALSLLQGFNDISAAGANSSFASTQFYSNPSDHHHHQQEGLNVINQTATNSSSHHQHDWPAHSFMMSSNNTTANTSDESAVWNIGNANTPSIIDNITGNVRRNTTSSSDDHHQPSFSPNQWPHDLP